MPSDAEFAAGIAAAMKIAQADLAQDVPAFFQSSIPQATVTAAVTAMATAAIKAAAAVRLQAK